MFDVELGLFAAAINKLRGSSGHDCMRRSARDGGGVPSLGDDTGGGALVVEVGGVTTGALDTVLLVLESW